MRRPEPPDLESLSPSQVERVNAVCNDFEEDWGRDARPAIHDYLKRAYDDTESVARLVLLRELLTLEIELREEDAKAHDLDAYHALFTDPTETEVLDFVLGEAAKEEGARRFRIVKPHAKGGLGEIFVARDEQLDRVVALKTIRPELVEHESSRARFIGEAEITGRLEHPSIVPVYALGRDRDKRPFYATRFIDGQPFDQAIEIYHRDHAAGSDPGKRQIALRKLLGNFIAVCNAVAFAHNRGILHRDIKPHNVMLGPFGETMLVDWGLAKEIGAPASDAGSELAQEDQQDGRGLSEAGSVLGTLPYMSPEQAEPKTELIGPASDVYSLGATLYHLLTGRPPFAGKDSEELRRKVIQGEFLPPRGVDRTVPPALDAIVRRAMALHPRDRYPSATALAEDIEHWLADEPVTAGHEPFPVRARRRMRRHRTLVLSTAVGLLVGVVGLAVDVAILAGKNRDLESQRRQVADQRDRAESEAAIANSVREFLNKDLLAQAGAQMQVGPGTKPDPDLKVREALDRAAVKIGERFANRPIVEASVRQTIGEAYFHLGLYAKALEHLERARLLRQRELGQDHPDTLETLTAIGTVYREDGKLSQAEPLLIRAMNGLRAARGAEDPRALAATHIMTHVYYSQGKLIEAEALLLSLREAYDRAQGTDGPETLDVTNSLAVVYEAQGKFEQAERLLLDAIKQSPRRVGAQHPITLTAKSNLALVYNSLGKKTEVERLRKEVLDARRSVLGDKHPDTLYSMAALGDYYRCEGQMDKAEPLFLEALQGSRAALDRNHEITQLALIGLAVVYSTKPDLVKLEPVLKETARIALSRNGPDHLNTAQANSFLAMLYFIQKEYAKAEPYFREFRRYLLKTAPDGWDRLLVESRLGTCLLGQKKYAQAEPLLLSAYNGMKAREKRAPSESNAALRSTIEQIIKLSDEAGGLGKGSAWEVFRSDPVVPLIRLDLKFPANPFARPIAKQQDLRPR